MGTHVFSSLSHPLPLSPVALCQTVKTKGESRLHPGPEEQLRSKPAKLTRSPWASLMHYSNQSILDHPDTSDIWVSVSYSPSPSVSPPSVFQNFSLVSHLGGSPVFTAASIQRRGWHGFLTVHLPGHSRTCFTSQSRGLYVCETSLKLLCKLQTYFSFQAWGENRWSLQQCRIISICSLTLSENILFLLLYWSTRFSGTLVFSCEFHLYNGISAARF